MQIDGRDISHSQAPYIVAEISCNHAGSLERAHQLIVAARKAGADAVKFQAYTPDTITIDHNGPDFIIKDGLWKGRSLYELYRVAYTPFEWFPYLFLTAQTERITLFASVFDKSSIDMLERLDCPAYKIASMEIVDIPLIEYASSTKKPIILSTGMATDKEIEAAAWACAGWLHRNPPAVLHCVSGYPANAANYDLRRMGNFSDIYGISDHTNGCVVPVAATALGANIIEKHFMMGDVRTEDYEFSLDPNAFSIMANSVRNTWAAMQKPRDNEEEASRQLRRSLYVVEDIKQGESFTEYNVRSIRPAYGLAPRELPWLLTKRAAEDLKRGTALRKEHAR